MNPFTQITRILGSVLSQKYRNWKYLGRVLILNYGLSTDNLQISYFIRRWVYLFSMRSWTNIHPNRIHNQHTQTDLHVADFVLNAGWDLLNYAYEECTILDGIQIVSAHNSEDQFLSPIRSHPTTALDETPVIILFKLVSFFLLTHPIYVNNKKK